MTLHRVSETAGPTRRGCVIFVHGLGGDAFATWQVEGRVETSWLRWLAADLDVDVYSLAYDASPSAWLGLTMPLPERAKNVLTDLETWDIATAPIIFVCHSFGGLLVKAMLRQGIDKRVDPWQRIVRSTRAVIFLSTPHTGARLATYLGSLASLLRLTVSVKELEANAPALRDLNEWYRSNARVLNIETYCFYEKQALGWTTVVDETSADPGLEDVIPVPVDANHFDICKPRTREELVYRRVKQLVNKVLHPAGNKIAIEKISADSHPVAPRGLQLHFDRLIKDHTRLFAGRAYERKLITDHLAKGGTGYIFVEGSSGYGKTSLLSRIILDHPEIAYHFLNQSYRTTGAGFDNTQLDSILASLCEQLDDRCVLPSYLNQRETIHHVLTTVPKVPIVVLIDGIDEVSRHPSFLFGLLPNALPAGVTVILSARSQGDRCYLTEVGLSRQAISLHIQLSGLDYDDLRELLQIAGDSTRVLASDSSFVRSLHVISQGDPFYLRFLVEDVASGRITRGNIHLTPVGLEQYLDKQFSQLGQSAHLRQQQDILIQILLEDGPLARRDLIGLVDNLTIFNFDEVLRDIHRFLQVRNDNYTFCHNRFQLWFKSKL